MDIARIASPEPHFKTVVAIPVRDEVDRIEPCLRALNRQSYPPEAVVLLLNNCMDGTDAVVRSLVPRMGFDLRSICCSLPPERANAGEARRLAMALAARIAGLDGVLLTTDADAMVPPDWIHRNLAALLRGADLVCGRAVIDPVETAMIPAHLHADNLLERRLIGLLDDMAWQIDPDPHDPPPRHTEASGASLAVWVSAFDRVGGIPPIPSGEDRAFAAALWQADAHIRHDPAIEVVVSGRVVGRADSGMAATLRRRMLKQDEYCDEQVEAPEHRMRRLVLRQRARMVWRKHGSDHGLAAELGIEPGCLDAALATPFFGKAWAAIEDQCDILRRYPVRFADLPAEIAVASSQLARLSAPQTMAAE